MFFPPWLTLQLIAERLVGAVDIRGHAHGHGLELLFQLCEILLDRFEILILLLKLLLGLGNLLLLVRNELVGLVE